MKISLKFQNNSFALVFPVILGRFAYNRIIISTNKTGFMTAAYHPESVLKSSESLPKPEKVWIIAIFAVQMLFLKYKFYFWSTNAIFFGVQNKKKKIERAVQTFAASWHKFCRFLGWVLPPYAMSFAALWCEFCRLMAQY